MSLSPVGVGVYLDSDTCLYHFECLKYYCHHYGVIQNYFLESKSLNQFIDSRYNIKFAAFHVPFVNDVTWIDRLEQSYTVADQVFVFCSELHKHTVDQLISLDRPNIIIFACGFINYQFKHAKIYTWMDWFVTTVYFYNTVQPDLLNKKLLPQTDKSKYFDILLGCRRIHRDVIYQYIVDNQMLDKVVMTYYQRWNVDLRETDHIFESEGLEFLPESNYTHSVHQVCYYGHRMNLSQVVPFVIYNDSYYSVVAETNAVNEFNFYTEKVVKPILGRRLFVAVAGQGYLQRLRSFGFKTFGDVIDESYDNEPDSLLRWHMTMDQVQFLITQDPVEIYAKIKDVVEHNQRLMLDTDWYEDLSRQLAAVIAPHLDSVHTTAD
jgi:hypothetical protein